MLQKTSFRLHYPRMMLHNFCLSYIFLFQGIKRMFLPDLLNDWVNGIR